MRATATTSPAAMNATNSSEPLQTVRANSEAATARSRGSRPRVTAARRQVLYATIAIAAGATP